LLELKTWVTKWKRKIDKTNEWVAWQWVNEKIEKESFAILKQTINIPKENMEYYHWVMFTHTMDFFKECASLKKPIPQHFFTSLLNNLSTEELVTHGNLLSTKFLKPQRLSMQL
jgi:hypothetical protein